MRTLGLVVCALAIVSSAAWCDEQHHHELTENEVGSVHFSTSCTRAVEKDLNRAVALLHSFQYEDARQAFEVVGRKDPTCAMAQWGVAMSHYHGLWDNGDTAAGREALRKAREIAAANPKTTAREKAYIDSLGEIYREDGKDAYAHSQAFEQKMAALQSAYPDDTEAAIFHALTLGITAPKTDKTFANQRKCGAILEPIFEKLPNHPGVAHYIIHCYDNPALAQQGLKAARAYAKIAPASAHANHMPSHIFTRVGSWEESVQSNKRSEALAAAAERTSKNGEARDQRLHAMDYMVYAYLQSGRVAVAKGVLAAMNALPRVTGLTLTGDYARAAIPARYTLELGKWEEASALQALEEAVPWAQAITWMAIGVGSARSGNMKRAAEAAQSLADLRDATTKLNNMYWSKQVEVQREEVEAWMAAQSGSEAKALTLMTGAADLEESMDKNAATPGAVTPAREMLGQLLLTQKRPQDALAAFEAVLKIAPKRFNALYGAASAADAAGNAAVAHRYFQELIEVSAGDERPEVGTARKKVAVAAKRCSKGANKKLATIFRQGCSRRQLPNFACRAPLSVG
jgi:tetratricopeptide (TPR) repeat protein